VNTLSYKTVSINKDTVNRTWYIVDGEGATVGRMASKIATVLKGKHKPTYTPHFDAGDYVIVVNADKVRFTGNKMADKEYQHYSGYPGGQKRYNAEELASKHPTAILELAIKGMLPRTKLGNAMIKKLFVYQGAEHPHAAQKPEPFKF
jgi:large subunit ribosomal protein L13